MGEYISYNIMNFTKKEQSDINDLYSAAKNSGLDMRSIKAAKDMITRRIFLEDKYGRRYFGEK